MFGLTLNNNPTPSSSPPSYTQEPHQDDLDVVDGKTPDCNRRHTFETFVPEHQITDAKPTKKVGHTWDVIRAVVKLKRPLREKSESVVRRVSTRVSGRRTGSVRRSVGAGGNGVGYEDVEKPGRRLERVHEDPFAD